MEASRNLPSLHVVESVRCLECGTVYGKPIGGGTVRQNPGCPECGYVGWLSVALPLSRGSSRARCDAGRPRRRRG
jgi:predicted  nucleic acid-binding Zn-ribbon protein